jgi:predicted Kef-type K+ transport protein
VFYRRYRLAYYDQALWAIAAVAIVVTAFGVGLVLGWSLHMGLVAGLAL